MNTRFKLVDKHKRSVLNEGRNKGLGHAFCIRKDDTLIASYACSSCGDYSSDYIFCQQSHKPYSAYGLTVKDEKGFADGKAYGFISVLKQGASNPQRYAGFEKEYEQLATNYKNMQLGLNKLEDQLKVPHTEISRIDANKYAMVADKYWVQTTYLWSLHKLILRTLMTYDGKQDVVEFLSKYKGEDTYMLNSALPKLKKLLNGFKIPPEDWSASRSWHNYGIVATTVFG